MNNQLTIQDLKEINAMAKILQEKSYKLMSKLGEEISPPPASKGLSLEDRLKARMKRDRVIAKRTKR